MTQHHPTPTPERLAKGDVVETVVMATGKRAQALDALDHLYGRKRITQAQWRAGKEFQDDFIAAGLVAIQAVDWQRIDGRSFGDAAAVARVDKSGTIHRVFQTLGGVGSPAGAIAWHVIGSGESLSDFANRTGQNPTGASGALIAVLCVIEQTYFGY